MIYKKPLSIFILSIFAVFLTGCSKDDDEVIVEENKPYKLTEIMWTLKEGDGQEIITEELPKQIFKNEGDTIMQVIIKPLEEMQGTSQFYLDDPEALAVLRENQINVSIPSHIEILSDSYSYVVGGTQVPFQLDKSYFPFSWSFKESTGLNPHTYMSYKATIYLKKITATFKARFVQEETYKSFEVEGKWTGVYFYSMESASVVDEIE